MNDTRQGEWNMDSCNVKSDSLQCVNQHCIKARGGAMAVSTDIKVSQYTTYPSPFTFNVPLTKVNLFIPSQSLLIIS